MPEFCPSQVWEKLRVKRAGIQNIKNLVRTEAES